MLTNQSLTGDCMKHLSFTNNFNQPQQQDINKSGEE